MPRYCLYHMPGSCSQVVLSALEEVGLPYDDKAVALTRGEHMQPDYLSINPKGKVPTLVADGVVVTELPIIVYRLWQDHPGAGLLPASGGLLNLDSLSDMVWFSGALHALVGRMFRPFTVAHADLDGVRAIATAELVRHAAGISARLSTDHWWYGSNWSMADVMIAWLFRAATPWGFPMTDFPPLLTHCERVEGRPSYARAMARERQAISRDGIELPPGVSL